MLESLLLVSVWMLARPENNVRLGQRTEVESNMTWNTGRRKERKKEWGIFSFLMCPFHFRGLGTWWVLQVMITGCFGVNELAMWKCLYCGVCSHIFFEFTVSLTERIRGIQIPMFSLIFPSHTTVSCSVHLLHTSVLSFLPSRFSPFILLLHPFNHLVTLTSTLVWYNL